MFGTGLNQFGTGSSQFFCFRISTNAKPTTEVVTSTLDASTPLGLNLIKLFTLFTDAEAE
jgi:hypothetical protein